MVTMDSLEVCASIFEALGASEEMNLVESYFLLFDFSYVTEILLHNTMPAEGWLNWERS